MQESNSGGRFWKLVIVAVIILLMIGSAVMAYSTTGTGSKGSITISTPTIINNYTYLLTPRYSAPTSNYAAYAGDHNISVANAVAFNNTDIIIMEMNNVTGGTWEQVFKVTAINSTMLVFDGNQVLQHNYSIHSQVIDVPNYDVITTTGDGYITAKNAVLDNYYDGGQYFNAYYAITGGVVAFRANVLNGTGRINTSGTGFAHGSQGTCNAGNRNHYNGQRGYGYSGDDYWSYSCPLSGYGSSINGMGCYGNNGATVCAATCYADSNTNNGVGGSITMCGFDGYSSTYPQSIGSGGAGYEDGGAGYYVTGGINGYSSANAAGIGGKTMNRGTYPTNSTNTTIYIGGGGTDTNGSGAVIIYARTISNLSLYLQTNDASAQRGIGGSGSAYINAQTVMISDAKYGRGDTAYGGGGNGGVWMKAYGGAGELGITANTISNTTPVGWDSQSSFVYGASNVFVPYHVLGSFVQTIGNTPINLTDLPNVTQNWNTTFTMQVVATNSSDCNVSTYASNNTAFPINSTTGLINWSANMSKVGAYSLKVTVYDTCGNTLSSTSSINITYNPITITSVTITPRPTGTTANLTCTALISNPDGSNTTSAYQWYKNNALMPSLENKTLVTTGNLTLGDQWVCSARAYDAITSLQFTNTTILTLGDTTLPVITAFTIQPGTISIGAGTVNLSVACTDNENVGSVIVQLNNPNGVKTNLTLASIGGSAYGFLYSPSTPTGIYNATAICTDGSGNTNHTTSDLTFLVTINTGGSTPPSGGSGGGSADLSDDRKSCDIIITPASVELTANDLAQQLKIENRETQSYQPIFSITSTHSSYASRLRITNQIGALLGGQQDSFGIAYDENAYVPGTAMLTLKSDNCKDITVPITVSGEQQSELFLGLFGKGTTFMDIIKEPVLDRQNQYRERLPLFNFGTLSLVVLLLCLTIFSGRVGESFKRQSYFTGLTWLLFALIVTVIASAFLITAIRVVT